MGEGSVRQVGGEESEKGNVTWTWARFGRKVVRKNKDRMEYIGWIEYKVE